MTTARFVLGCAAVASAAAMLLGSWAPFHLHRAAFEDVWQTFLNEGANLSSDRGDLVANVLLSIPFAFSFLGLLQSERRRGVTASAINILFTILATGVLSLVCELGQGWLGDRVSSTRDFFAQLFGSAIGCTAWLALGSQLTPLLNRLLAGKRVQTRSQAAITLTAMAVLVWSIMPGDVLTSPGDLARKWTSGRIELIPFTRIEGAIWDSLYQWMASLCLAVPLGLWGFQFAKSTFRRGMELSDWILMAVGLGILPELLQIPIRARIASATDALFGVAGAGIGIWIGHCVGGAQQSNPPAQRKSPLRQPAFWLLAAAGYLVVVSMLSWYPFRFVTDSDQVRGLLRSVADDPFNDYRGSNLRILFVFTRLAVISAVLGGLAGIGTGLIRHSTTRKLVCLIMLGLCTAASIVLELGQLLEESHSGAGLGLLTRTAATLVGFALGLIVVRGGRLAQMEADAGLSAVTQPGDASLLASDRQMGQEEAEHAPHSGLHVPGMDGLRALACLAVFGVHWQQMTGVGSQWGPIDFARLLENGNTGVAMFMILSGFLLALPVFASTVQQRQQFCLKDYWTRRAVRILPAYYLSLGLLAIITSQWRSLGRLADVLLHTVFLHNMTAKTLYSINAPFWALAPIVQFYALFAVLLLVLKRLNRLSDRWLLLTSVAIGLLSQLLVSVLTMSEPASPYEAAWIGTEAVCLQHSLGSHVCIFVFGMVAAWVHLRLGNAKSLWADAILIVGAIGCGVILATPIDEILQIPGGRYNFPAVPLLLTAMLLAAPRAFMLGGVLEALPLRHLGVISYGFYLFHLPLMKGMRAAFGDPWVEGQPFLFAIGSIAVTILLCEISYRWLEKPIARAFRR